MPFNTPLTAGQITQARKSEQYFEHYLLVTPNDIVFQAQISSTKTDVVYGNFNWITTLQGAYTDVVVGQVVLITNSSSDLTDPVIRGRVRKDPTDVLFYINENGINIDTTMYITVLDTFDVVERIARVNDDVQYVDYDIPFQRLPPTISDLQSAYVDFSNDATVTWSFSPTITAQASGATISSYLWDVGDGTITVGSTSTKDITVQFPGAATNEHRWVHFTATDSNGVAQAFHFQVWTVDRSSSAVVALDTGQLSISGTIQDGWNGDFVTWSNFAKDDVLDLTRVVIAGISNYDGTTTPITSNILMIGQIRTETNTPTSDENSVITETRIDIEGFASQLARIPFVPQQVIDDDTPTLYGDIINPTPERIAVYILAYNTTILSLCAIDIEDLSASVMGDQNLSDTNAVQNVLDIADTVNKATLAYAPSGEIALYRNANYISSTDRNALDTIFNFEESDYIDFSLDIRYSNSIGQAKAAAIVYDTTKNAIGQLWTAQAPAESFGGGYEETRMGNQVLTADSTQANARSELSQRTANDLAFVNAKPILSATMTDGFYWCIPSIHQWWTHTIGAALTIRERTYSTSNRWWLSSVSYTCDNELNTRETNLTWELETESTNAGIVPTLVSDVNEPTFDFSPLGGYDFFIDDPLVNYSLDDPDFSLPGEGNYDLEPYPPALDNTPTINQEILNIPMGFSKNVSTTRDSVLSATYTVNVSGDGEIGGGGSGSVTENFTTPGNYSFPSYPALVNISTLDSSTVPSGSTSGSPAVQDGGLYDTGVPASDRYRRGIYVLFSLGFIATVSNVAFELYRVGSPFTSGSALNKSVYLFGPSSQTVGDELAIYSIADGETNSTWVSKSYASGLFTGTLTGISHVGVLINNGNNLPIYNNYWLDDIVVSYSSGSNRGDAFYDGYENEGTPTAYSAGNGLLVDTANPTAPPYSDSHNYTFDITGTGSPFVFTYGDSSYADNGNNILKVIVTGDNMGVSS